MIAHLFSCLIEDTLRGLSGPLGYRLRRFWYRHRFSACGSGLVIEPNVHIVGAAHIQVGDHVWLDRGVLLIAGPPRAEARIVAGPQSMGQLRIGNHCHLGLGTVVQAHGDVRIGDCFTSSAGVKIYSFSNDPAECRNGTIGVEHNNPGYRITPVDIGRNVCLGLNVLVLGARIGDDCFLRPQAVAMNSIPAAQVAGGAPAQPLRPRFPKHAS